MVRAPPSCPVEPDWYQPTAQTSFAATPSTAFKTLPLYVPGLGLGMMLQLVPFQCSVNVCKGIELGSAPWPTAQMSLAEIAATPFSSTYVSVPGFGLGITLQRLPFQCSTRLCRTYKGVPLASGEKPTAHTSFVET